MGKGKQSKETKMLPYPVYMHKNAFVHINGMDVMLWGGQIYKLPLKTGEYFINHGIAVKVENKKEKSLKTKLKKKGLLKEKKNV